LFIRVGEAGFSYFSGSFFKELFSNWKILLSVESRFNNIKTGRESKFPQHKQSVTAYFDVLLVIRPTIMIFVLLKFNSSYQEGREKLELPLE